MKKIIGFLFVLLLLVSMFYGLFYLRSANFYQLVFEDRTFLDLGFNHDLDAYHRFLSLAEEKGLTVSRIVYPDSETTLIYSTDVTLGGQVQLLEGEFPPVGSPYFISSVEMADDAQIGLMADVVPEMNIIIGDLRSPRNVGLDGQFQINTTDSEVVNAFIARLQAEIHFVHLIDDMIPLRLLRVFMSASPRGEIGTIALLVIEIIAILPTLTLCLFLALIQYVLSRLKSSAIFLTHGYGKYDVAKMILKDLIKVWLFTVGIAYGGIILYWVMTAQWLFLRSGTLLFGLLSLALLGACLLVVYGMVMICLHFFNMTATLKGQKVDGKIQVLNHGSKLIFTGVFLFLTTMTFSTLIQVNARLAALSHWEKAENVYQIQISLGRRSLDWENISRYDAQKVAFYQDLLRDHNGFMMDAINIRIIDIERDEADEWGESNRELHLLNRIENVKISPSFLTINPIYTREGEQAYDLLILDGETLNVLLPERMLADEIEIYEALLESFPRAERLHMIYVEDGQFYFTFNSRWRLQDGNRVLDPFALIYEAPLISDHFIANALSHSVYFVAQTNQPFLEIEPLIHAHGLQSQIQWIRAIYDDNVREVRDMQAHQVRLMGLLVLLVITNLSVAYNLIANYFE
ncbi:MAG: hypothetical protein FWG67_00900, partial [Defluviitaleaceae bacterium]|nr:hypothetical protein [Defluviitaleaceae bacterium]